MSEGVKETLCTRCAHREVCIYKQDFLDIIKAVENASIVNDMNVERRAYVLSKATDAN